ncbi:TetR/AcrR family transcriptional regulator [Pseudomonas sp. ITEM 17296]|uniref:TetR/AcrR family transcriptional regulator n=1 Tax=Pseudomonas sp. ITEM 17296 TaxID=2790281 RepID=UPI00237FF9A7|nr:TetR/AcrR family transcriptional regulator [Pseudomonas sp. ITEM 17296]MDE4536302.1 TetR/AcrR family transcriptional regulator [Pseudomonas sp. ITEM 17296]
MSTRTDLLASAESLLRTKGYAAFSYADLAHIIGISKASIHHHFPTKEKLGVAIVENYIFRFCKRLEQIDQESESAVQRLIAFSALFRESRDASLLPLCGALAAEIAVLPDSLRKLTKGFFELHLRWVEDTVKLGQEEGEIKTSQGLKPLSRTILNFLEGEAFVSWAIQEDSNSENSFECFLSGFTKHS